MGFSKEYLAREYEEEFGAQDRRMYSYLGTTKPKLKDVYAYTEYTKAFKELTSSQKTKLLSEMAKNKAEHKKILRLEKKRQNISHRKGNLSAKSLKKRLELWLSILVHEYQQEKDWHITVDSPKRITLATDAFTYHCIYDPTMGDYEPDLSVEFDRLLKNAGWGDYYNEGGGIIIIRKEE